MRITAVLVTFLGLAGSAHASPVTLICTGSITAEGKQATIDRETAILDLEKPSFKPPNYPELPVTQISESSVSFGIEQPHLSTWGSLDRVSGSLSMSVMKPSERRALQAGEKAHGHFLVWMTAKCAPARRMF
jgi:hypothetical protein